MEILRGLKCTVVFITMFSMFIPAMECASGDISPSVSDTTGKANVYYVDMNHPSASDSNSGRLESPWLTIGHAAETLKAGDTVYIREGIYKEHIYLENSGDASGYIVFAAYEDEIPIIDGTGVEESQNGIVVDKSYIKLIGIEICNWEENGIWVENASHIEITDCVVHDVAYGIGIADGTHDFELNRVVMHDFDLYGFDVSPAGGADCYNGAINDCVSHTGRDADQNVDGFAVGHGSQHGITFNRCEAYDVFDGFDIGENAGDDVRIVLSRCSSHGCWNDGYKVTGGATLVNCMGYRNSNSNVGMCWGSRVDTVTLQNCTFADAGTFNIWVEDSGESLRMFNCILACGDNIGLAFEQMGVGNYTGDYNIFHNDNSERGITVAYEDEFTIDEMESGAWTNYSGQDANSLICRSDVKLFIDPVNFDLHLVKGSIAVDYGTSYGAPSDDFDGNVRPCGKGYDIGAYECKSQ